MRNKLYIPLLLLISVNIGCGPRGETKSLDEILKVSQDYFKDVSSKVPSNKLSSEVSESIKTLNDKLSSVLGSNDININKESLKDVLNILNKLTVGAGYTSRAQLGEISSQYNEIIQSGNLNENVKKLIVSRTYSLIASELEGVRFSLKDRELKL